MPARSSRASEGAPSFDANSTQGKITHARATGMPGDGYFAFADARLGRDVADRRRYWESEVERVWDTWSEAGPR
jgi:hypothetical protein